MESKAALTFMNEPQPVAAVWRDRQHILAFAIVRISLLNKNAQSELNVKLLTLLCRD
jgi:hypothetical protein